MSNGKEGPTEWILVGVDLSTSSREALIAAHDLASRYTAGCLVLHVIEGQHLEEISQVSDVSLPHLHDRLEHHRRLLVQDWIDQCWPVNPDVPREVVVRWGIPFEELLRAMREYAVDRMVVGTGGRSRDLSHVLFGGTAEKVLRGATVPVLCVPARPSP